MSLIQSLQEAQLRARKDKDQATLGTIQMILSHIKNEQINLMKRDISEEEVLGVLRKFIKQLKDALTDFEKAGRQDLIVNAKREIDLVSQYLPQQLTESEIESIARDVIAQMSPVTEKDLGKVIGRVMKETAGRADGALVQTIIKRLLPSH